MNTIKRLCLIMAVALTMDAFVIAPFRNRASWPRCARVMALYQAGKFAEAVPLAQQALAIAEKGLPPPAVAQSLTNLALLYDRQARYADAESLYKRSLAINEKALGADHPDVAASLTNLANLYGAQGRYADAEPLYKRSLAINEKALGPGHPNVAISLATMDLLYDRQGRYADAESLYKRALAIREKAPIIRTLRGCSTTWLCSTATRDATVTPRRCTSGRWRAVKRCSVPAIRRLRGRSITLLSSTASRVATPTPSRSTSARSQREGARC
jgi:tetratricopeptide (TPR) repeat protein